jgi:hypothetical protein
MEKKTALLLSLALGVAPIQAAAQGFDDGEALGRTLLGIIEAFKGTEPKPLSFGPLELKRAAKKAKSAPDAVAEGDVENLIAAGDGLVRFSDETLAVLERRGVQVAICDSACQKGIGKFNGTAVYDHGTKRVLVPRFNADNGLFAIPVIDSAIEAAIKSIQ